MTEEIRMTKEGNKVVFKCGTKHLTEVPVDAMRTAIQFATEMATETLPEVNVVITVDGDYEVDIHKWHENPIAVVIREYNGATALARFNYQHICIRELEE